MLLIAYLCSRENIIKPVMVRHVEYGLYDCTVDAPALFQLITLIINRTAAFVWFAD